VIEQKFLPYETDFTRQLKVIGVSRVDGIVLWTDQSKAALILKQMRDLGMTQAVFGSHRTLGDELIAQAGPAAEGFQAVYPYDPSSRDPAWRDFSIRYEAKYYEKPDHFAALAYDQMQILLQAICKAGLNRAMIRDALYGTETYTGVTGTMLFDPNDKQLRDMYLGTVHNGHIEYRKISMQKEYARVGEDGVHFSGPPTSDVPGSTLKIAVFGPSADKLVLATSIPNSDGRKWELIGVSSDVPWGKASDDLVRSVYDQNAIAIIALDRTSSHLAEQIGVKAFVPVLTVSSDKTLTSINIPWIFRLPEGTSLEHALRILTTAEQQSGGNRSNLRGVLASGNQIAGVQFQPTGEPR
jgi:hypothetical protein